MKRLLMLLAATWLAALPPPAVTADEFILASGGTVKGELLNPDESPRRTYVVKTDSGGVVTLSATQVKKVVAKSDAERRYEAVLPKMPRTADGNWKMAKWCGEIGLKDRRKYHLEQVLRYEPDHVKARYALGYSRVDGRWVIEREFNAEQGYVMYKGRWHLPQAVEIDKQKEKLVKDQAVLKRKLRMWRSWMVGRNAQRAQEGRRETREIKSPVAAKALGELLLDEEYYELKKLYIEVLGELKTSVAAAALAKCAMTDKDERVRDLCWEALAQWQPPPAAVVAGLVAHLEHKDNAVVNRAAIGLAHLKDPETVVPLIDALVTKHKFKIITSKGNINPIFGRDSQGGSTGGLGVGGNRPKIVERSIQNPSVLTALTAITGRADHQYDQQRWRQWYAETQTPEDIVSLRRDE